jgi:protein ImuB
VVKATRAATRPYRLRPLREPQPLRVETDAAGVPMAAFLGRGRLAVADVLDRWRVDDEWWRERPVSRLYYRLELVDGRTAVVYNDLVQGQWYAQKYA